MPYADPAKGAAYRKEYYRKNRDRIVARSKANYSRVREGLLARLRAERAANPKPRPYGTPAQLAYWDSIRGKPNHNKGKKGHPPWNKGRKMPESTRAKMEPLWKSRIGQIPHNKGKPSKIRGPLHYAWRGGVTPIHEKARRSMEYRQWRKAVMLRDEYTCVECGQVGGELQADHLKPFCRFPELRYDINNGRTLCVSCHKATPTYGRKALKVA